MPTLVIYGMPTDQATNARRLLVELPNAVSDVKEIGVTPAQVSVFFPADAVQVNLGHELKCTMPGTFMKPERTPEALNKMAQAVKNVLVEFASQFLPRCKLVEVYVERFDPTIGFATWSRNT